MGSARSKHSAIVQPTTEKEQKKKKLSLLVYSRCMVELPC